MFVVRLYEDGHLRTHYLLLTQNNGCMLSYKVDNEMGRGVVCIYLGVFLLTVGTGVQKAISVYINGRHSEAYSGFRRSSSFG